MIFIFFSFLALFLSVFLLTSKKFNIVNPIFLLLVSWGLSTFGLIISSFIYNKNSIVWFYVLLGLNAFILFLFLGQKITHQRKEVKASSNARLRKNVIHSILLFEILLVVYTLFVYTNFVINNYEINFFFSLKKAMNNGDISIQFVKYIINFSLIFSVFIHLNYVKYKNISKKYFIMQLLITLMMALITLGRTSILLFIISNFSVYVLFSKVAHRKLIINAFKLFLVFILFFIGYNFLKYQYRFSANLIFDELLIYTSGSLAALANWYDRGVIFLNGSNLFRFPLEVLSVLMSELKQPNLVNDYISIGEYQTNVYTIFKFYIADFGVIYSIIIMSILGFITGIIYKKYLYKTDRYVVLYSLLCFPLVMQFFQDQYISLTSMWVQFLLYLIMFYETKIFYSRRIK